MAHGSGSGDEGTASGAARCGGACLGEVLLISRDTGALSPDDPLGRIAASVRCLPDARSAVSAIRQHPPDLVILEQGESAAGVVEALRTIRAACPAVTVVVAAASRRVEAAIDFIREGAVDYIEYPLVGERLERLVSAAPPAAARATGWERFFCSDCPPTVPLVGRSKAILRTMEIIRAVAESNCNPVLLLGESGTGKELAARAVHAIRCRANDNFVAVNCAALTPTLLEGELFGHAQGSFTGADREKAGLFETAGSGTILLDEISEMPASLQAKLLRVLQEKSFRKVGGTEDIPCNATIIASSNRDLLAESASGNFRKDLYYRLAVFPVTMPPLRCRTRRDDIPLLAEYFMASSTIRTRLPAPSLGAEAREKLTRHDWPGNVRELKNVIDRALILETGEQVSAANILIDGPPRDQAEPPRPFRVEDFSLETAEREFIVRALKETKWQRTRAAALLGITRATLGAKIRRYEIEPSKGEGSPAGGRSNSSKTALHDQPV